MHKVVIAAVLLVLLGSPVYGQPAFPWAELWSAIDERSVDQVNEILDTHIWSDETFTRETNPFRSAYDQRDFDLLGFLLKTDLPPVEYPIEDGGFGTYLHEALQRGDTEMAGFLLRSGHPVDAAPDYVGWSSDLTAAIASGLDVEIIGMLVRRGADPDGILLNPGYNETQRIQTISPLSVAIESGREEVVSELLRLGADPNLTVFSIGPWGSIPNPAPDYRMPLIDTVTPLEMSRTAGLGAAEESLRAYGGLTLEEALATGGVTENSRVRGHLLCSSTVGDLRVRREPNLLSRIVDQLVVGEEVMVFQTGPRATIAGLNSRWCLVMTQANVVGWVFAGYLHFVTDVVRPGGGRP